MPSELHLGPDDILTDEAHDRFLKARSTRTKGLALGELLKAAEPFIRRMVAVYSTGNIARVEREEAMQTARLGFLEAVRRFDGTKGPLRPYAMKRIRHALQDIAERSTQIKIPRSTHIPKDVLTELERIRWEGGREPTDEELGEFKDEYLALRMRPRLGPSMDEHRGLIVTARDKDGASLHEMVASEDPTPLDVLLDREEEPMRDKGLEAISFVETPPPKPPKKRTPKKESVMPEPMKTSPLEALHSAVIGVQQYEKSLVEEESRIKRERETIQSTLSKLSAALTPEAAPVTKKPIMSLGQKGITNRITAYLKDNPGASMGAIMKACGETRNSVTNALDKLRRNSIVKSTGKARGTRYSMSNA